MPPTQLLGSDSTITILVEQGESLLELSDLKRENSEYYFTMLGKSKNNDIDIFLHAMSRTSEMRETMLQNGSQI